MSFSSPPPRKAARTGLQRTGSYLSLEDMQAAVTTTLYGRTSSASPSSSSRSERVPNGPTSAIHLSYTGSYVRLHRHAQLPPSVASRGQAVHSAASHMLPTLQARADLYRVAITTRMRMSPEGRKILYMGRDGDERPERIVASQREGDGDTIMTEDVGQPWVVVPPEDWEMVDCAA
ncbi:uncharacterized protein B0H18DRAFT_1117855 [Fomitopsis serialis]|uniref:uncharacterized protein n=1 Tax=Fomitopsis serialis TaxID=139415 RepID=UPI00200736AD|nr:uncharacterized protein B0H18DRAFT_1117855 [Neoantrodia serialis]KAH9928665.1 hypothetical protein B0H18DRAFT_1117855 [Neoantrodia serialis]